MTSFALNNLWTYLQGLSLSQDDREWLANKLIMPKENELKQENSARLDEALKKFSGDFGGSADAMTVARELRQSAEMVNLVTGNVKHFERIQGLKIENWMDH